MTTSNQIVSLLEAEWTSISDLAGTFAESEWVTETDLPGWRVKDVLAHLIGTESFLLGRDLPKGDFTMGPHVKNPVGESNERWVQSLFDTPGSIVLDEFRSVTKLRLEALHSMTPEDFVKESWTPRGQGTYQGFMEMRAMDCWMHEQDIRRAVGRPGHLEGPVVEHSIDIIESSLPYVVGKKAKAPQGSTVVFALTGPGERSIPIGVDGRATRLDATPSNPTVTISCDVETFCAVTGGRWDPSATLRENKLTIAGDEEFGRTVVESMPFMI